MTRANIFCILMPQLKLSQNWECMGIARKLCTIIGLYSRSSLLYSFDAGSDAANGDRNLDRIKYARGPHRSRSRPIRYATLYRRSGRRRSRQRFRETVSTRCHFDRYSIPLVALEWLIICEIYGAPGEGNPTRAVFRWIMK